MDAIYNAHQSSSRRKHFPDEGRAVAPSSAWCSYFRGLTAGLHLCGAVPSFDEERLRRLFVAHGLIHRWPHPVLDAEALAVGPLSGHVILPVALPSKMIFPYNIKILTLRGEHFHFCQPL